DDLGEILLPKRYVPENTEVGDEVDVFVYFDSEDIPIATTETPYGQVDEFAFLKVIAVNHFGAFLDWGLMKDLFVPFKEQIEPMVVNKSYVVFIYHDQDSNRICASTKVNQFVYDDILDLKQGDQVDTLVVEETHLGFKTIVNGDYLGLLYHNEIFAPLAPGDKVSTFIKRIREDGRLDLTLQKPGYQKTTGLAEQILELMKENDNQLALNAKSSADDIHAKLQMSKKSFKMAIGKLYKAKKIVITETGISLV
ncbi:MAG: GntR family transcriptional regulator, partial [Lentisphaeria bacterium]|nr:GntR family transcriptional regulator [Lentisphaeria bacterium]